MSHPTPQCQPRPTPIKGDVEGIFALADAYDDQRRTMDAVVRRLKFIDGLKGFRSMAIDALSGASNDVLHAIEDVATRYDSMAEALYQYGRVLARVQPAAKDACRKFEGAWCDYEAKGNLYVTYVSGSDPDPDKARRLESDYDWAATYVSNAWEEWWALKQEIKRASRAAAKVIDDGADKSNLFDSAAVKNAKPLRGTLNFFAGDGLEEYGENVGYAALAALTVPIIGAPVAAGLDRVSAGVSNISTVAKVVNGDKTIKQGTKEIATDVVVGGAVKSGEKVVKGKLDGAMSEQRRHEVDAYVPTKDRARRDDIEDAIVHRPVEIGGQVTEVVVGEVLKPEGSSADPKKSQAYKDVKAALEHGATGAVRRTGSSITIGHVRTPALDMSTRQVQVDVVVPTLFDTRR